MSNRDHLELRALDPVAQCLIRRLMVPRVYFDAPWPGLPGRNVDVLAIDRDGVGDVHIIEVKRYAPEAIKQLPSLVAASAPFRWIAFMKGTEDAETMQALATQAPLFAKSSAGRIGVIEIVTMEAGDLGANVKISAERFPDRMYDVAKRVSDSHKANIQFGE